MDVIPSPVSIIAAFNVLTLLAELEKTREALAKALELQPSKEYVLISGEDSRFEGIVVARFKKLSGVERVVVENKDGVLHIYKPSQLQKTVEPQS